MGKLEKKSIVLAPQVLEATSPVFLRLAHVAPFDEVNPGASGGGAPYEIADEGLSSAYGASGNLSRLHGIKRQS